MSELGEASVQLPRRERNKLEKRTRLTDAARVLFSRKGFVATTTAEIAERAGVAAGTLFLYFPTKEDLLVAIFREQMDAVVDGAFDSLPRRASLLDEIVHVYGAMIRFHEHDVGLARAFVKELLFVSAQNRDSVFTFIERLGQRIAERIEMRQRRGELDESVPALLVADNCFALFITRLQKWLGLDGRLASEEHIGRLRAAFALQLRGLETPQGRASQGRASRRKGG